MVEGSSLKEKIISLRKENKSYNEISILLNCSKAVISYHCINLKINNPIIKNIIITKNDVEKIKILCKEKKIKDVAKLFKCYSNTKKK